MPDTLQSLLTRAESAERCAEALSKLLCKAAKYPEGDPAWDDIVEAVNAWAAHKLEVRNAQ